MAKDPRAMLEAFTNGLHATAEVMPNHVEAFMGLLGAAYTPGAVDVKTKELISCAIAVFSRCEYCIVFHVFKALEAGATREEIMESAMVAVAFGGGPAIAYTVTLMKQSIDEFEGDFKN